jgi:signal peptidase I
MPPAEEDSNGKLLRDYGATVVVAVAVALLIRFFLIEAYRIPTIAMRPTLEAGDTVFVGKWPLSPLRRGDLILYSPEESEKRDYIKRVVGLAGDTVQLRSGQLFLNGKVVPQNIVAGGCGTETLLDSPPHTVCLEPPAASDTPLTEVPPKSVYVLGDLRTGTQFDPTSMGKSWGVVPLSSLKGKVLWIWLSIDPGIARSSGSTGWFPKFRFERMFRRVD